MPTSATPVKPSKTLWIALVSSVILIASLAYQWDIIEIVSPFLWMPYIGMLTAWMTVLTLWTAIDAALRWKSRRWIGCVPLIVCLVAGTVAYSAPITDHWLDASFHRYKEDREQIVAEIESLTASDRLLLSKEDRRISKGGTVIVQYTSTTPYVFFYTYLGILDNYSGFLWVPPGCRPEDFDDASFEGAQIDHVEGNWYFFSHS